MHIDPYLIKVTAIIFFLLLSSIILKRLKQPYVVAYLIAGVLLGPSGLNIVDDVKVIEHVGSFGVVLLLFFVGLEVSPESIIKNWRVSCVGTILQIALSVGALFTFGSFLNWPLERSILLGFVISLSSTAVVVQYLKEKGELTSRVGDDVLGILIMQDIAIIPMLVILGILSQNTEAQNPSLILQLCGAVVLVASLFLSIRFGRENFKGLSLLKRDRETQVLAALTFALGFSLISGLFGLSTALGAFIAGAIIRAFKQIHWVHDSLESLRVVFLAMFFASVGLLVDLHFFAQNWQLVSGIVFVALLTNTVINSLILRLVGRSWQESLYSASLLSQIGEFSFVLAAIGLNLGIINKFSYDVTILTIFVTMILTPIWIGITRRSFLALHEGQKLLNINSLKDLRN